MRLPRVGGEREWCALRDTLRCVKKTSLYLQDADVARLRRLASAEGKSQAEIIREALARYEPTSVRRREFPFFDSIDGAWDETGRSVADIPEEELLAGFGDERAPQGRGG